MFILHQTQGGGKNVKRNPIIPYFIVFALGIILVFFLGIKGIGDAKKMASEDENGETVVFEPESWAQQACIVCHGDNLEGKGNAPSLVGTDLTKDEIVDILINGTEGGMPPGTVPSEHVEQMAEWILNLK